MAANDKVKFLTGAYSSLNSVTKVAGQILFAVDNDNYGYLYYDKDSSTRINMLAPHNIPWSALINIPTIVAAAGGTTNTTKYTIQLYSIAGAAIAASNDPTTNGVIDIPAATTSIAGLVTTGAQTFAGKKTFNGGIVAKTDNDFISHSNEFNFVPALSANMEIHINHRTAGTNTNNAKITKYLFKDGNGGYAVVKASSFEGSLAWSNLTSLPQLVSSAYGTTNASKYTIQLYNIAGAAITATTDPTTNGVIEIPIATDAIAGLMGTTAQTFSGAKTFMNGLEVYGTIAGDSSTTNGHGLYNGGAYSNAHNSIILHGDTAGVSGIAFTSSKQDASGAYANINAPSDRAFIQFHSYGITTLTAEGTAPTLATSGEANKLVIGVGNDSNDEVWIQTPGASGLKHIVGTASYVIIDSGNYGSYIPYVTAQSSWTAGTTAGPIPVFTTRTGGTWNGTAIPAANGTTASGIVTTAAQTFGGVKTFSGGVTVSASGGFNYSGIQEGTANADRIVWFSDNSAIGKPVYDNDFKYNPSTNTLKVPNIAISGTFTSASLAANSDDDSTHSTETAALKITGGASISRRLSAKMIRVDNGSTDTTKGFNLIYDSTNECLKFQFGN